VTISNLEYLQYFEVYHEEKAAIIYNDITSKLNAEIEGLQNENYNLKDNVLFFWEDFQVEHVKTPINLTYLQGFWYTSKNATVKVKDNICTKLTSYINMHVFEIEETDDYFRIDDFRLNKNYDKNKAKITWYSYSKPGTVVHWVRKIHQQKIKIKKFFPS
jgi:hypothetical protein